MFYAYVVLLGKNVCEREESEGECAFFTKESFAKSSKKGCELALQELKKVDITNFKLVTKN